MRSLIERRAKVESKMCNQQKEINLRQQKQSSHPSVVTIILELRLRWRILVPCRQPVSVPRLDQIGHFG